jgi:hypothetical protein
MAKAKKITKIKYTGRHPVVSLAAEHLVIGQLMRRNILAYKGPNNYEGYDIVCVHPDHRRSGRVVRIQVKSRSYTTAWGFPIKEKSLDGFDFLIYVRLNVYKPKKSRKEGVSAIDTRQDVEFYTLKPDFIKERHNGKGSYAKVNFIKADIPFLQKFKNEKGFDMIAKKLNLSYPDNHIDE